MRKRQLFAAFESVNKSVIGNVYMLFVMANKKRFATKVLIAFVFGAFLECYNIQYPKNSRFFPIYFCLLIKGLTEFVKYDSIQI